MKEEFQTKQNHSLEFSVQLHCAECDAELELKLNDSHGDEYQYVVKPCPNCSKAVSKTRLVNAKFELECEEQRYMELAKSNAQLIEQYEALEKEKGKILIELCEKSRFVIQLRETIFKMEAK